MEQTQNSSISASRGHSILLKVDREGKSKYKNRGKILGLLIKRLNGPYLNRRCYCQAGCSLFDTYHLQSQLWPSNVHASM